MEKPETQDLSEKVTQLSEGRFSRTTGARLQGIKEEVVGKKPIFISSVI